MLKIPQASTSYKQYTSKDTTFGAATVKLKSYLIRDFETETKLSADKEITAISDLIERVNSDEFTHLGKNTSSFEVFNSLVGDVIRVKRDNKNPDKLSSIEVSTHRGTEILEIKSDSDDCEMQQGFFKKLSKAILDRLRNT